MRILHVIGRLDPAGGGPQAVVLRLAAAQAQYGHDVAILSHDAPHRAAAIDQAIDETAGADRLRFHRIEQRGRIDQLLAGSAVAELRRLLPKMDVLHMHGLWDSLLLRAAWQAEPAGTPFVITLHGLLDPWSLAQRRLKKRIALAVAFRRMLNAAAIIHALNDDEKRLIEPLGLRAPVLVVPNGVNLQEIDPLPEAGRFRAAHPELGSRPYLLFLSRLHYKKGLDILADAFALFVEGGGGIDLVVAGPDDGARTDFERRIREHALEHRVHVIGPIYGRQKLEGLRDAAGFILPSRQEGFSIAITEAMAVGLPVIITENCHFPEVAAAGAGLVTALELRPIAEAITSLASDPSAAAAMGRAGRQLVESRYAWPKIAQQMVSEYQRISQPRERTHTDP